MISMKFDPGENILHIQTEGEISLEEAKGFISEVGNNKELPRKLLMLERAMNANWKIGINLLPELMDHLQQHTTKFENVRHAVLHLDPVHQAYSSLLNKEFKHLNYQRAIFPSEQHARIWLNDGK